MGKHLLGSHADIEVVTPSFSMMEYHDGRKVRTLVFWDQRDGERNIELEFHQFTPDGRWYFIAPPAPKKWWQFWRV